MMHRQSHSVVPPLGLVLVALLMGCLLLGTSSCAKKGAGPKPGPTKRLVLKMKGMTCGGCVKILTQSFQEVKGAKAVTVTLKPPRAVITYDSGAAKPTIFVKAAEAKGYTATVVKDELVDGKPKS